MNNDSTFDLDLDGLDLKTIDLEPTNLNSKPNINVSSKDNSFENTTSFGSSSKPDLTISTSNSDLMPSMESSSDFGLSLLANKNKQRTDSANTVEPVSNNAFNSSSSNSLVDSLGLNSSGNNNSNSNNSTSIDNDILNSSSFDNLTNIKLDNELSSNGESTKETSTNLNGPSLPDFSSNNASTTDSSNPYTTIPDSTNMSYEDIQKAKFDLLCKFERLRAKGVKLPQTFSMSSDYEEMKYEYDRLMHQRKMDNSVKMQRQMLISFVTGVEYLNNKFDPFDLKLNDWSENVHENINDYDDIFEELYEKYKGESNMAPELRLLFTLSGSAFMYHLSNTMFKSSLPNVNDVFKQNPDLMQQFTQATMNSMSQKNPGFAGFMGDMMNKKEDSVPKYNPMSAPPFNNPSVPERNSSSQGPPDLDTLINDIENDTNIDLTKEINLG